MKRYLKHFEISVDFIEDAITECLKTKWRRRDTSFFLAGYSLKFGFCNETIEMIASECHKIACDINRRNEFDALIRMIAEDIYDEIKNECIYLRPIRYQKRIDKSNHKLREIGISSIKQQVYDYIMVNACKEMFMAKIGMFQCSSIKGRGQIYGKKAIERWIRNDKKNTKYAYKCDIKSFYPSVDHNVLKSMLSRDIKNNEVLYVLFYLIDTYKSGLCIGSYLSQFLANYYLSYAYHFMSEQTYEIKRNGKKVNYISHILFYMDDIIVFSSNKRNLRKAVSMMHAYCNESLKLKIKDDDRLFQVKDDVCIDMMGFKIYLDHTTIRKRIWSRIFRFLITYKDKRKQISIKSARAFASYYGWIKNTDHSRILKRFKVDMILNICKGVIRNDCTNCIVY